MAVEMVKAALNFNISICGDLYFSWKIFLFIEHNYHAWCTI